MARSTSPQHPVAPRALIALATAGAALGAGAATASADSVPGLNYRPADLGRIDPQAGLQAVAGTTGYVTGPVAGLKPNPLAGTGVDPLNNGVATQLADFQPVGSQMLTAPVAEAPSVGSVPVLGQAVGVIGGVRPGR